MKQKIILISISTLLVLLFALFQFGSSYYLDYLWFTSLEQLSSWWKIIKIKAYFYTMGVIIALLFYIPNLFWILLQIRKIILYKEGTTWLILLPFTLFLAFAIHGPIGFNLWEQAVLYLFSPDYGLKDPIYEIDVSFHLSQLHFYINILNYLQTLVFFTILTSIGGYFLTLWLNDNQVNSENLKKRIYIATPHISLLVGLLVLFMSLETNLDRHALLSTGSGFSSKVAGASYTDIHALSSAYYFFSWIGYFLSIIIFLSGFFRHWKLPFFGLGSWFLLYILTLGIYPSIIQFIKVNPNEFEAEKPYIEHSIRYTLEGYNLAKIERKKFPADQNLNLSTLNKNREIIDNIRLWDYRPVKATLSQLQEIRQYYDFIDVDVDRYIVDGKIRQVLIAARELNKKNLPTRALTWESKHLQYTHGYGIAMAPSNLVTREGLPELWIRDFPPLVTQASLPKVRRPEIYYGELNNDYILVNTSLKEIDYPLEQNFAETVYQGKGGIALGTGLRYLLLSWEFDTWKMLISRYVHSESKILFRRSIHEIVRRLAPFLEYDADPYIILGKDGKLYWMIDAYTHSPHFPYSASFDDNYFQIASQAGRGANLNKFRGSNYIRNSIKVIIDAYSGETKFYLVDEKDPIAKAWSTFLPELIQPLSEMPDFLQKHMRYAEELFFVQASMYTDYHMSDARALYNLEDRWQIASEVYSGQRIQVEPYYTVIKLPKAKKEEYTLMLPFIPNNKDNMIAWMAGRSDYESKSKENPYGKVVLFDFPRTRQVYGPIQIEARIDQDPDISKDLTLWNQQGSRVIRGNLLVIPIGNTLLYVEPIYLQSTNSPFPELRRVIVADENALVMGRTLQEALVELASQSRSHASNKNSLTKQKLELQDILPQASRHLEEAQKALSQGDWLRFGQKMEQLQKTLNTRIRK